LIEAPEAEWRDLASAALIIGPSVVAVAAV